MKPLDHYLRAAALVDIWALRPEIWWTDTKSHASLIGMRYDAFLAGIFDDLRTATVRPSSAALLRAAMRGLDIPFASDEAVRAIAQAQIDRIDADFANRRKDGQLKSINKNYRTLRLRGRKVPNYAEWVRALHFRHYAEHADRNRLRLLVSGIPVTPTAPPKTDLTR